MPHTTVELYAVIGCLTVVYVAARLLLKGLIRATDWAISWVETWKD